MDLQRKVRILENLLKSVEELDKDTVIKGQEEQAYNLCLIAQDLCLRLITELDLYKSKTFSTDLVEDHTYITDKPNWQNMPRIYPEEYQDEEKEEEDKNDT